jgi:hypothetical protein
MFRIPKVYNGISWTLWDQFVIEADPTLAEFIQHFKDDKGLEITMILYDQSWIYSSFLPPGRFIVKISCFFQFNFFFF